MKQASRIQYLDALRGWAIFIVVWVHSTWLTFGADVRYMWCFAVVYPMPLFFAVSGYFRGKRERRSVPWKRWAKMLLLLLTGSAGYALCFGVRFTEMFGDKYYYWFFAALLVCELLAELLERLMRRYGVITACVAGLSMWLLMIGGLALFGLNRYCIPWADLESYWPFYLTGMMMGRDSRFQQFLTSARSADIGLVLLCYGLYAGQPAGTPQALAGGLGGLMLTWYLFQKTDRYQRVMAWLGRRSLGIFLLSYPVLKWMAPLGELVPREWVDSQWQWVTAFVAAIPLTLAMAAATYACGLCEKKILTLKSKKREGYELRPANHKK